MPSLLTSEKGKAKIKHARDEKGWKVDDQEPLKKASEVLTGKTDWPKETPNGYLYAEGVSPGTWKRFLYGTEPIDTNVFKAFCTILNLNWQEVRADRSQIQTGDNLEDQPNEQEAYAVSATWQRERYYGQFIGRDDTLQEILKRLESEEEPKVLSIVGIGGLGKTALCHRLVDCAYQAKIFSKIAWIRAKIYQYQTDSLGQPQSCRDSYLTPEDALKDIGKELKLPNWILQDPDRIRSEIARVLSLSRWLIVIDGLEDTESPGMLATELSSLLGKSRLIFTSRQLTDTNIFEYKLTKLGREISREFIQVISQEKYLPSQNPIFMASDSQIQSILKITDGMPLAMKLLVSQAAILDLDRIIERLQSVSEEQKLYNYLFEDSWKQLRSEQATNAQKLLIYLAHRPRPVLIKHLYDLGGLSKRDVDEAIKKLITLSLVDISSGIGNKKASLHSFTARYFSETLRSQYE